MHNVKIYRNFPEKHFIPGDINIATTKNKEGGVVDVPDDLSRALQYCVFVPTLGKNHSHLARYFFTFYLPFVKWFSTAFVVQE